MPEIEVFLKCKICGTFLTSASFRVIQNHFEKCRHNTQQISQSSPRLPEENEDNQFGMECDFMDDEMESVTFSQPFVLLGRCSLDHSIKVISLPSKPTPKSLETLSNVIELKSTVKVDEICVSDEGDLELAEEDPLADTTLTLTIEKQRKQSFSKKPSWVVNNLQVDFPFKCSLCTAGFNTENRLEFHKRCKPRGEIDTFSCSICGRTFHHRDNFQNHLNCHERAERTEEKFRRLKNIIGDSIIIMLKCKFCLMPLTNHASYVTHMTTNHSDKGQRYSFACPYTCSTQTNSIKQLIQHFKTDHSEHYYGKMIVYNRGKQEKCDECGKLFYVKYLPVHKALHAAGKAPKEIINGFECPYLNCQSKCKELRNLKGHFILHLQNNPYICIFPGCTVKFDSPNRLNSHMKMHLATANQTRCTKCRVSYTTNWKMKTHKCQSNIDKQASGEFEVVQVGNSWRLKPSRMANSDGNCDANKSPIIKERLSDDEYMEYVKSVKRFNINAIIRSDPVFIQACKDCPGFGELLLGANYLTVPDDQNKSKINFECSKLEKSFQCEEPNCGMYFSSDRNKQGHFRRYHVPQYPCPECDKRFLSKLKLDKHLEMHRLNPDMGLYKTSCDICGIKLYNSYCVRRHKRVVHGVNDPLPDRKLVTRIKTSTKKNTPKNEVSTIVTSQSYNNFLEDRLIEENREHEVYILPDAMELEDNHDMQVDYGQVVKREPEDSMS